MTPQSLTVASRRADLERCFREATSSHVVGWPLFWLDECGSTNDVVRELAAHGFPEGTFVAAERQTAGRGRKGDPWFSPPGQGLWCSFLLHPPFSPEHAPRLTLVLANALMEALDTNLGVKVEIKPPNDVLLGGRKLAGILAESSILANAARLDFLVLGIGVNVSTRFHAGLAGQATSLAEHLPPERVPTPTVLAAWLATVFERRYIELRTQLASATNSARG